MKQLQLLIFLLLTLSIVNKNYAQDSITSTISDTTKVDSLQQKKDIYTAIEEVAKKHKWTKRLHKLIFNSPSHVSPQMLEENKSLDKEYTEYANKPIRNINIHGLDPFGTNIYHPDSISVNFFTKLLNSLHANTHDFVVTANLLFKKGDLVNPYTIAEAETYLRNLNFVSDVRILLTQVPGNDSVDVAVILRDKFSIGFHIKNITPFSKYDIELYDRNIAGLGSELNVRIMQKSEKGNDDERKMGYGFALRNRSIFRTFIRTEFSLLKDFSSETFKAIAERPIQQGLTYFGGVNYTQKKASHYIMKLLDTSFRYRQEIFSATFGRTFDAPFISTNSKFVVASRFLIQNNLSDLINSDNYRYLNYPFEKKCLYIASLSLFQQRYYRNNMVYNFGTTEDIAYGYNITAQLGYENHTYFERMYGSVALSGGIHTKAGYVYSQASIGSYFRNARAEQGVFRLYTNYFSPLIKLKNSFLRQFISIDYTEGLRRLPSANELIYFSHLTDFSTSKYNYEANGTRRFVFNTETDWFSPLYILGFRAVFFSFVNLAWIGNSNDKLFSGKNFFSGYGIGIRTRNEQLVFKTIQIKLAWYPQLSQSKFTDFTNFSTSDQKVSPNFKPEFPNIIPFE